MFAFFFEGGGEAEQLGFADALGGADVGDDGDAARHRPRLIEDDDLGTPRRFQGGRRLKENPAPRPSAAPRHDGDRRGET